MRYATPYSRGAKSRERGARGENARKQVSGVSLNRTLRRIAPLMVLVSLWGCRGQSPRIKIDGRRRPPLLLLMLPELPFDPDQHLVNREVCRSP